MTTELLRLAELCEQAVFPCVTQADAEVLVAIKSGICRLVLGREYDAYSPDYTASLDAAMTLVPDRFAVHDLSDWTHDPEHLRPHWSVALWWLDVKRGVAEGEAATPALALCAAALRARSFLDDAND